MSEKREYLRIHSEFELEYQELDKDLEQIILEKVKVKDLSEGGVCIISFDTPLPTGKKLKLKFGIDTESIIAIGEVKWSKKLTEKIYDNGISFTQLDSELQNIIQNFILVKVQDVKRKR